MVTRWTYCFIEISNKKLAGFRWKLQLTYYCAHISLRNFRVAEQLSTICSLHAAISVTGVMRVEKIDIDIDRWLRSLWTREKNSNVFSYYWCNSCLDFDNILFDKVQKGFLSWRRFYFSVTSIYGMFLLRWGHLKQFKKLILLSWKHI